MSSRSQTATVPSGTFSSIFFTEGAKLANELSSLSLFPD